MNWWGSGFITQIIYSTFGTSSGADDFSLLTEDDFNILTESGQNIDIEN